MAFKMKGFSYPGTAPKNNTIKKVVSQLKNASKMHAEQAEKVEKLAMGPCGKPMSKCDCPKSPLKQKKTFPKSYTKKDIKFLKKQREDVVRYEDLDEKGKAIWKKQGKPIPKSAKKSPLKQKKRRKDQKIKNTDGTTRVKPIKNVGTDPTSGESVQNMVVKRADRTIETTRYSGGKEIGKTAQPKVLKKKRIKKLKTKNIPRKLKSVKAPEFNPTVKLDNEAQKVYDRRKRVAEKNKNKTVTQKITDKAKKIVSKIPKIKKGPKIRKVKNLVTGGTNTLR